MARTRSPEVHAKVLSSARTLLYERGIDAFTIEAVAQHSGVAKTTIYRHFPSAHELLIEALGSIIEVIPTPNTGSLREDLTQLFVHRLPLARDERLRAVVLGMLAASANDPALDQVASAMKDSRSEPIRTVVQLAIARGEIPDIDLDLAVDLIEGPLFVHVYVHHRPIDDAQVRALIDLAVAGLQHRTTTTEVAPAS